MDEKFLNINWPVRMPPGQLEYSLVYEFSQRLPITMFERLSVKLQHHLVAGTYTRRDWRDVVYVKQNGVSLLLTRHPQRGENPSIEVTLRARRDNLQALYQLTLDMYRSEPFLCL